MEDPDFDSVSEESVRVRIFKEFVKTLKVGTVGPPIKDPPRKRRSFCKGHPTEYLSIEL